jgi:hypothetical protein
LWEQELVYWVDWLDAQRQLLVLWSGRLEGLLARHWSEATRVLKLTSATLLHALVHYGGPAALAADSGALARLVAWGGHWLVPDKVQRLLSETKSSVGIRQDAVQTRQVQQYAAAALQAQEQMRCSQRRLARLVRGRTCCRRKRAWLAAARRVWSSRWGGCSLGSRQR